MRQPEESFAFLFLKEMPLRCEAMVGGKNLGEVVTGLGVAKVLQKSFNFSWRPTRSWRQIKA